MKLWPLFRGQQVAIVAGAHAGQRATVVRASNLIGYVSVIFADDALIYAVPLHMVEPITDPGAAEFISDMNTFACRERLLTVQRINNALNRKDTP